jgi:hypothetical protein
MGCCRSKAVAEEEPCKSAPPAYDTIKEEEEEDDVMPELEGNEQTGKDVVDRTRKALWNKLQKSWDSSVMRSLYPGQPSLCGKEYDPLRYALAQEICREHARPIAYDEFKKLIDTAFTEHASRVYE